MTEIEGYFSCYRDIDFSLKTDILIKNFRIVSNQIQEKTCKFSSCI